MLPHVPAPGATSAIVSLPTAFQVFGLCDASISTAALSQPGGPPQTFLIKKRISNQLSAYRNDSASALKRTGRDHLGLWHVQCRYFQRTTRRRLEALTLHQLAATTAASVCGDWRSHRDAENAGFSFVRQHSVALADFRLFTIIGT
ncbi:hypothetical protein SNOG_13297 [Parastagonospora nodorum SN15]|uniref:Uncharacterized protein n=1 Tax=Phaeosphaeria nodorum (strain SN15 / ATCC MYA-4574 / FGSC 10173) TaxID=321614 RepID=Q0U4L7_PHANO|nr:hypothetical protein SNOG_13297 [Parastagonospora nodorum SN15]EAT79181.1 hypothetical protein SNOG_13297 [Parastagonospora nodorum SN15]